MNDGRIIAIGDIHGCSVALATLINAIQPTPLETLVFLGDYIDRGPDSRGVLEQAIHLADKCQVVPLLGNHEEMLLAALEGKDSLRYWLKFGGRETLDSYGVGDDVNKIRPEHIQFIKRCRNYYDTVHHIFVHAYYDPDRPLYEQLWTGLRWLSLPRIPMPHCSSKIAIVGHTPQKTRQIFIGPKAQRVLGPWLKDIAPEDYVFSPARAEVTRNAERRQQRRTPLWPSHVRHLAARKKVSPKRAKRDRYDTASYRRAVQRACKKANVAVWSPNQLRHTAATRLRRKYGIEVARIVLGHSTLVTTLVYAEADVRKAMEVMAEMG